jgi:ATP-dependent Clp protease protease subunit
MIENTSEILVYTTNDTVYFHDAVDAPSVSKCIQEINKLKLIDRKDAKLTLVINSPGGLVTEGLMLYDYLRELSAEGVKIVTKAMGEVASMAVALFLAGDERIIADNTLFLVHYLTGGTYGKYEDAKSQMKSLDILNNKLETIIQERTGISEETVKELMKTDTYLDKTEAIKYNFST